MTPPSAREQTPRPLHFDATLLGSLGGLEWKARYVMEGFLTGLHGSPFHGASVEFRDYRDYQPGDELRHVDWRLYARADRLCVKRFEHETNARCYVLVDTSGSMEYRGGDAWGSKIECARVIALALSWLLLKQKDAVGLLALAPRAEAARGLRFVRPSERMDQVGVLIRELAALAPLGGAGLSDLLAHAARVAHRRSLIILFSDLLEPSEDVERGLRQLRFQGHEIVCVQLLDRDEIEFPFEDGAVFEDLETADRCHVMGAQVRAAYLRSFREFMSAHETLFRELEMPHALIRTDEDPGKALARFLVARSRRA